MSLKTIGPFDRIHFVHIKVIFFPRYTKNIRLHFFLEEKYPITLKSIQNLIITSKRSVFSHKPRNIVAVI